MASPGAYGMVVELYNEVASCDLRAQYIHVVTVAPELYIHLMSRYATLMSRFDISLVDMYI